MELQPNYGLGGQGLHFGAAWCFDSNLKTACSPANLFDPATLQRVTGTVTSALAFELKEECFPTTSTCPQFDIKSVTIYTPTVNISGYQPGFHSIKVSLRNSLKT